MSRKILAVDSTNTIMATEYVEKLCVLNILALVLENDFKCDWAKGELYRCHRDGV
jgi:hypothetical protein